MPDPRVILVGAAYVVAFTRSSRVRAGTWWVLVHLWAVTVGLGAWVKTQRRRRALRDVWTRGRTPGERITKRQAAQAGWALVDALGWDAEPIRFEPKATGEGWRGRRAAFLARTVPDPVAVGWAFAEAGVPAQLNRIDTRRDDLGTDSRVVFVTLRDKLAADAPEPIQVRVPGWVKSGASLSGERWGLVELSVTPGEDLRALTKRHPRWWHTDEERADARRAILPQLGLVDPSPPGLVRGPVRVESPAQTAHQAVRAPAPAPEAGEEPEPLDELVSVLACYGPMTGAEAGRRLETPIQRQNANRRLAKLEERGLVRKGPDDRWVAVDDPSPEALALAERLSLVKGRRGTQGSRRAG